MLNKDSDVKLMQIRNRQKNQYESKIDKKIQEMQREMNMKVRDTEEIMKQSIDKI